MNKPARTNVLTLPTEPDTTTTSRSAAGAAPASKKKRRFKGRNLLLFGILAWAAYTFLFVQNPNLKRLETEQGQLTQEIGQMEQVNQELKKKIDQLHDPDYIAEIARKRYMMVKEGETLFVESKQ
ncbi:MAG TPA: septum formation initiator family protein [Bacilli bacterium]|nr:septum formation initiator family protein [Bacilli bacterium]